MNNKLSVIIIGNNSNINVPSNINVIYTINGNISINDIDSKYICFINGDDSVSEYYFDEINNLIDKGDFDSCYIKNDNDISNKRYINDKYELSSMVPCEGTNIWEFVYNVDSLRKYISCDYKGDNKKLKEEIFKVRVYSNDVLYHHMGNGIIVNNIFGFCNRKKIIHISNIIYMDWYLNGIFNGYISWLKHLGRYINHRKDITIIYTKINEITKSELSKYFNVIELDKSINYTCDKLIVTYATYYYTNNIFCLDKSYMFIHGNMSDYKNSRKFHDDIYDYYVAVSKTAMEKAKGYFPTDDIKVIYNPFICYDKVMPCLRLVAATRNSPEKCLNRMVKLSSVLDELDIPYTFEVFTDVFLENKNGLYFRKGCANVISYINDADYLVCLSNTESLSYAMVEALSLGTKVISTPLDVLNEIGVIDGKNAIVIPFSYFDDGNENKLKEKILLVYLNKDIKFDYEFSENKYKEIYDIFK